MLEILQKYSEMNMKSNFKKILSVILCLMITLSCTVAPAFAGYSSDYPEGVTAKEALTAVDSTDTLLKNILPALTGKTLAQNIKPMLYNSDVISSVVISLYSELSQRSAELESIGVDISVSAVAENLNDFPNACEALKKFSSWEEVKLDGVDWGVNDKNGFATALAKSLSPLDEILYMALCSGTLTISRFIKIEGANGYETSIVPLLKSLKCPGIMTQSEYTADANIDRCNMIKNILLPVLSLLENAFDTPMATLTDSLPSVAYFVESGQMDACMQSLLDPIKNNKIVEIATFLKILDLESFDFNMTEMLTSGITDMTSQSSFKTAEIDFTALSKCGKASETEFVSDKGKAYVMIMRWLVDTLKLNEKNLPELMKGMGDTSAFSTEMVSSLLSKETDALVGMIILLFAPSQAGSPSAMVYPDITPTSVQYTPNLTKENYDKVLNEIDSLLDDFVKESGSYRNIESMLKVSVYTNENVNSMLTGIYATLEKEGLLDMLTILDVDASPKGVAECLKESGYSSVANTLKKAESWDAVSLKGIKWGFDNGSRRGFQNALTAILRPLFPLLRVILAGEDVVIMDTITIKGGDGYNTAVIPILEALGCKSSSVKSYSQYVKHANSDGVIGDILEPIFDLLDDVFEKPVKTLTGILPNIVYFMNSGSVEKCISNLLLPITALSSKLAPIYDMSFDTSGITKALDLNSMLNSMLAQTGMKIADFDINTLATLGTKTELTSKTVLNGARVKYSYIEADKTGVLMSILRVFARTVKLPGNENLLTSSMGDSSGAFSTYSSAIGEQFAAMTEDEIIEWLYNLLFKERAKIEIVVDEETYTPTIIYKEPAKDYTWLYAIGAYVAVLAVIGVVYYLNRKRLYY